MNLLEKVREIVEIHEHGGWASVPLSRSAPAICRAVLSAMEEMEKEPLLPEYHNECEQIAYTDGTQDAISILRKHLGVE